MKKCLSYKELINLMEGNFNKKIRALPIKERLSAISKEPLPQEPLSLIEKLIEKEVANEQLRFDYATEQIRKKLELTTELGLLKEIQSDNLHTYTNFRNKFKKVAQLTEAGHRSRIKELYTQLIGQHREGMPLAELDYDLIYVCIINALTTCYTQKKNEFMSVTNVLATMLKHIRINEYKYELILEDDTNQGEMNDQKDNIWEELEIKEESSIDPEFIQKIKNDNLRLAATLLIIFQKATGLFEISEKAEINPHNPGDKKHSAVLINLSDKFLKAIPEEAIRLDMTRIPHMLCPPNPHYYNRRGGLLFAEMSRKASRELLQHIRERNKQENAGKVDELEVKRSFIFKGLTIRTEPFIKNRPGLFSSVDKENNLIYCLVNKSQSTPYTVNPFILQQINLLSDKSELILDGFVTRAAVSSLEKALEAIGGKVTIEEKKKKNKTKEEKINLQKRYETEQLLKSKHQEYVNQKKILAESEALITSRYLFSSQNLDFRARLYLSAFYNFQNADWIRALMEIADPYPVDLMDKRHWEHLYDRGCEYLRAPKLLGETEHTKVYKHLLEKVDCYTNCLEKKGQTSATLFVFSEQFNVKKPFSALRWLNELSAWREAVEKGETVIKSKYINWLDAHASACQHLSLVTRDLTFMHLVGLYPPDKEPVLWLEDKDGKKELPDYYKEVVALLRPVLTKFAYTSAEDILKQKDKKVESDTSKIIRETQAFVKYILGDNPKKVDYFTRSLFKTAIMGDTYAMTPQGMGSSIYKEIEVERREYYAKIEGFPHPTMAIYNELGRIIKDALTKVLPEFRRMMNFLQKVCNIFISKNKKLVWKTSIGLSISQAKYRLKKNRLVIQGTARTEDGKYVRFRKQLVIKTYMKPINEEAAKRRNISEDDYLFDLRANKSAVTANLVHSLDATILFLVLNKWYAHIANTAKEPFTTYAPIYTIHDSFGVPITLTAQICKLYAETLEEMYVNKNVLREFWNTNLLAHGANMQLDMKELSFIEEELAYFDERIKSYPRIKAIPHLTLR